MTLADFIAARKITATSEQVDSNPQMQDPNWNATHYRVTLRLGRKQMTVPFSMGRAHTKPPTASDVLDCLASDAAGWENAKSSFAEWCDDYGYDTDSRKAERTFKLVERTAERLKTFLGDEDYEALLWEMDRSE